MATAVTTAKVYAGGFSIGSGVQGDGSCERQPRSELVCLHRRTRCGHRQGQGGQEHGQDRRQDQGHGTAKPVGPNAKVDFQVKKNGKWNTKAEKALAADGSYKLKTNAPGKPGKVKLLDDRDLDLAALTDAVELVSGTTPVA